MRHNTLPLIALLLFACQNDDSTTNFDHLDPSSPEQSPQTSNSLSDEELSDEAWTYLTNTPKYLDGIDGLTETRIITDDERFTHVHYAQIENDVLVYGGESIIHLSPNGTVFRLTDSMVRHIEVDTVPNLLAEEAINIAVSTLSPSFKDVETPEAQLFILREEGADFLVWKVDLYMQSPQGEPTQPAIFIDAHTGTVVKSEEHLHHASLSESSHVTYDMRRSRRFNRAVVGDSSDADLLLTHNSVSQSLEFLQNVLNRNSYDDNGAQVRSYGHYSRDYVNAYWDGSKLVFGDGDGVYSTYLGVLDVTAHELGHAMTEYEANLIYSGESGALNEGASDILAAAVEAYVDGGTSSSVWDIGEDCWLAGSALRYMSAPSADGSSKDHYSDRFTGSGDNGGVHYNSGIANHFFYLLTEGGQHHNAAFRSGYTVNGIGVDAAYAIWYRALQSYMTSSTNFSGARQATESACINLGYGASDCDSVSLAWFEVGVGSDPLGGGGGGGGPVDTGPVDTGPNDTGTSDTSTPSSGCAPGWQELTGTLTSGTDDQYSYSTSSNGTHQFELNGAPGTDFDLYLYKANRKGRYSEVASSTSSGSIEAITYTGKSADYIIQVTAYSGSGSYALCTLIQ